MTLRGHLSNSSALLFNCKRVVYIVLTLLLSALSFYTFSKRAILTASIVSLVYAVVSALSGHCVVFVQSYDWYRFS